MARTYTEQPSLPPTSGATFTGDGEPLHSRIQHDMPRALNNLWRHVDKPVGYCQAPGGSLAANTETNSAADVEIFLAQTAMLIPRGVTRVPWTLGVKAWAQATKTCTLSQVRLYVASAPYNGPQNPFDSAGLAKGYAYDAKTGLALAGVGDFSAYYLIDREANGVVPFLMADDAIDRRGWLILTGFVTSDVALASALAKVYLYDFTAWGERDG